MKNNEQPSDLFAAASVLSNAPISSSSSSSLKRKRPAKIEIPNVLREILLENNFKSRDGSTPTVSSTGNGVAVTSMKGKKKFMEDTHKIVSLSHGNMNKGFFGVYDGHGGKKAAEFVAEHLHTNILKIVEDCSDSSSKEEAVKAGYLLTDHEFLKQGVGSGACCVTALIEGTEIVVSNLGDCRAVLSRGGIAEALTKDHRAEREDERKRIEDKGGYAEIHRGAWRVHGILSVSRSIGDAHLKDWVIAEPDTKTLHFDPDMEFIILASDGLWDEVENQEAVDTVKRICSKTYEEEYVRVSTSPLKARRISLFDRENTKPRNNGGSLVVASKELANMAVRRGSMDDITVMIIDLNHFRCNG